MDNSQTDSASMERYSRQMRFYAIGEEGQRKLGAARVSVIGCGGLGCVLIGLLARAGVGELMIVDRDAVDWSNLQRQILYNEADAAAGLPKAVAAAQSVQRITSLVKVQSLVADVNATNIESIISGSTVVLDGTDNFETRYLINDACVKLLIPWVYGGVLGSSGMSMTIRPHDTACLRCVFPNDLPQSTVATPATEGILGSIIATVGAIEVAEAMKIIIGDNAHVNRGVICLDVWSNSYQTIQNLARNPECPCCGQGHYEYLSTCQHKKC